MFLACLGLGARNDGLCVTLLVVIMFFFLFPRSQLHFFVIFSLPIILRISLLPSNHLLSHFLSCGLLVSFLNCSLPMSRFFFLFPTLCVLCALAFRVALFQAFSFACCSFSDRP